MSSAPEPVYDAGPQPERTLLAWQRTALAVVVLSAVGLRFTAPTLGWPAVALGGAGVALGVFSYLAAHLGYRRAHHELTTTGTYRGTGWPQACISVATLLLGCLALAYVW